MDKFDELDAVEEIKKLRELALRNHYTCEDYYYNCQKIMLNEFHAPVENPDGECTCGADFHNIKVHEVFNSIMEKF